MKENTIEILKKRDQDEQPKIKVNGDIIKSANVSKKDRDRVVFDAPDSDAIIFFPNPILTYNRQEAPEQVIKVSEGTSEKLVVHVSAQEGEYSYAIWVYDENDFVDPGSHPSIIIER